jgi:autotransporter-associated beta strand protein
MKLKAKFGLFPSFLTLVPAMVSAQTTFFTDNFSNGSTTNLASVRTGSSTSSATSYDIASPKNTLPASGQTNGVTIAPNDLHLALNGGTTAGFLEAQALFATNGQPVALTAVGDYIDVQVVFTNTLNSLVAGGTASSIWLGLFNSGGSAPVAGGLAQSALSTTSGSAFATGNCANWQGYVAQIYSNATPHIITRPIQNGATTTSANQELLGNNAGSGAFVNPGATILGSSGTATTLNLTLRGTYTIELLIALSGTGTYTISNTLYAGAGTAGTVLLTQGTNNVTGSAYLTTAFDGIGIGTFNKGASLDPVMDISSISITGQSTPVAGPPLITMQPVPVLVATNGACQFSVAASGIGVAYQWYRNGTSLTDGGHISGSTSSTLTVAPSQTADSFNTANGYYVKVSGTGNFSTNSVTNSLVLMAATNLVWADTGNHIWDLTTNANWVDQNNSPENFNYGDSVVFNDNSSLKTVTLIGSYLSASSVTVNSASGATYTFSGSGSFAGPGTLIYTGTGQLTLNNANTYSGGTLVSNELTPNALYVYLQNYNGLGSGPIYLDNQGGTIETVPTGAATTGFNGTIDVLTDFNILVDGVGTYATVFLGDLAGASGKTLTINPKNSGTTNRFRAYGVNTTYNANLVLDNVDSATSQALYNGTVFAPYGAGGSQKYNGVISGVGGIVQRGTGTTYLNNNQNTYSGGTVPTAGAIGFGADSVPTSGTVTSGPIGTGVLLLAPEVGSLTASGQVFASGGAHTIGNTLQFPSGTNNLTLIIGGTNNLTFTAPFALNGADGVTTNTITSRIIQVTNTAATIFNGVISDSTSTYALTKTGSGALYLDAANTYTGVTTNISAAPTNALGLLAGTGSIAGNLFVQSNSAIGGGDNSGIGTFTVGGNLTLNGNGWFRVNRSGPQSDKVSVTGTAANIGTGTITVTNLGSALQIGDTFTLFNQAVTGGAALAVTNTGGGILWSNGLAVNGKISVLGYASSITTITNSPVIQQITLSGSNIILTGTNGQTSGTAYLLMTTNVANSISTWKTVATNVLAGNTYTFTGTNVITPALGHQFYRLSSTNYNP